MLAWLNPVSAQAQDATQPQIIIEETASKVPAPEELGLTPRACSVALPEWATPAEQLVWGEICNTGQADVAVWTPDACAQSGATAEDMAPWALSRQFMTLILTDPAFVAARPSVGVALGCAFIPVLDLRERRLAGPLRIQASTLDFVGLSDARIDGSLSFDGSHIRREIGGFRMRVDGPLRLIEARVDGPARFQDAAISGFANLGGAQVTGTLDFERAEIGKSLFLRNGAEFADVNLSTAKVAKELDASDAAFAGTLFAQELEVGGTLRLSNSRFEDQVSLTNARIGGTLNAQGAAFAARLSAFNIDVGGSMYLRRGASFDEVNLLGAQIAGTLETDGSRFTGRLRAQRIQIGGALTLRRGAHFADIDISSAHVGGSVDASGAAFDGLFRADQLSTPNNVFLRGSTFAGDVNLVGVDVDGHLQLQGSRFEGLVNVTEADVGSLLLWRFQRAAENATPGGDVVWGPQAALLLRNARTGSLQARMVGAEDNWHRDDGSRLPTDLNGFSYAQLGGFSAGAEVDLARVDTPPLIDWVAQSVAPGMERDDGYRPQPYRALETALTNMGADAAARQVAFARLKHRSATRLTAKLWSSPLRWTGQVLTRGFDRVLQFTVGFGVYPARAFYWFFALVIAGAVIARKAGQFKRASRMDCFWYSLENAIPLIEPSEDHKVSHAEPWVRSFFHFQKVFGFLLASVLIGSLTLGG